ncbi:PEP-CTERM sorting domain-containing protein [Botrimarina sp.]|uniref:PEP-CTERM sorting domain-containing protein n=1 Tax=Botrimarina sp. TaxID=2795802 RepID=UPI0032EBD64B
MSVTKRVASLLCGAVMCFAGSAQAELIQIGFTGLDLSYDGATLRDVSANGDVLSSVSIEENGVAVAGSPFGAGISMDLEIPGLTLEDVMVDEAVSAAGGSLLLNLPGGDFLNLSLAEVQVTYINTGFLKATFGGTVADVVSQQLPTTMPIGSPVEVTFSANISTTTASNGFIDSFLARGSGEISGEAIPEPASLALVALAGVAAAARRRS